MLPQWLKQLIFQKHQLCNIFYLRWGNGNFIEKYCLGSLILSSKLTEYNAAKKANIPDKIVTSPFQEGKKKRNKCKRK